MRELVGRGPFSCYRAEGQLVWRGESSLSLPSAAPLPRYFLDRQQNVLNQILRRPALVRHGALAPASGSSSTALSRPTFLGQPWDSLQLGDGLGLEASFGLSWSFGLNLSLGFGSCFSTQDERGSQGQRENSVMAYFLLSG